MIHILDLNFLNSSHTIAAFLVETSIGPVLIETGPHSTLPQLKQQVEKQGYQLEDIPYVLLSHIHLDHAGAAWALAQNGTTVYVHPAGEKHLLDPSRLMDSARRIYQDKMDVLWGEMHSIPTEKLKTVQHGESLIMGDTVFRAWHTPGHAVHHLAWQVGTEIFTGDVGGVKIDSGIVVPPCPPPDIHVEDWQTSIRLIESLNPTALYLTHYGKVTNVQEHLEQLERQLLAWANWMKPYAEKNADPTEITPLFQAFAQEQLRQNGITDQAALERYEKANPSWMSVAGLMRYWKKVMG